MLEQPTLSVIIFRNHAHIEKREDDEVRRKKSLPCMPNASNGMENRAVDGCSAPMPQDTILAWTASKMRFSAHSNNSIRTVQTADPDDQTTWLFLLQASGAVNLVLVAPRRHFRIWTVRVLRLAPEEG